MSCGGLSLASMGLVVVPTETVYAAAGVLTHPAARERLRLRPLEACRAYGVRWLLLANPD